MHPFKHHADKSGKSKMGSIHKGGSAKTVQNLGYSGSGGYKHVDSSHSDNMEIKDHPVALARGGKAKHSKHKSPIARSLTPPAAPSPDEMAMAQAGAGMLPSPAPAMPSGAGGPPGMPMQKRGGKVKYAKGGRIPNAGQATGEARLQQAGMKGRK